MAKKLSFSGLNLDDESFEIKEDNSEISGISENFTDNKPENKFDSDNFKNSSSKKPVKKYIYKDTFNRDLDKEGPNASASLYNKNKQRLKLLKALNPKVTEIDLLNYIFEDFFLRNSQEIIEEHNYAQKNLKNNLL